MDEQQSIEDIISKEREKSNVEDVTLPVNLGLDDDKLNEAIEYIASNTADVPKFMESFSTDKLKNITSIATIAQLARIPGLIKQINEINTIIINSNVYNSMDKYLK